MVLEVGEEMIRWKALSSFLNAVKGHLPKITLKFLAWTQNDLLGMIRHKSVSQSYQWDNSTGQYTPGSKHPSTFFHSTPIKVLTCTRLNVFYHLSTRNKTKRAVDQEFRQQKSQNGRISSLNRSLLANQNCRQVWLLLSKLCLLNSHSVTKHLSTA